MMAKGFDPADAVLRTSIRDQVGSIVKRLRREGMIESVGFGRASKWKPADT
jgi:chromosome condensin MukBEF MukE localization factor